MPGTLPLDPLLNAAYYSGMNILIVGYGEMGKYVRLFLPSASTITGRVDPVNGNIGNYKRTGR
jgi:hypothetical protein